MSICSLKLGPPQAFRYSEKKSALRLGEWCAPENHLSSTVNGSKPLSPAPHLRSSCSQRASIYRKKSPTLLKVLNLSEESLPRGRRKGERSFRSTRARERSVSRQRGVFSRTSPLSPSLAQKQSQQLQPLHKQSQSPVYKIAARTLQTDRSPCLWN